MTSLRQIESNRRNALRSTGPQTEAGKQRSSGSAVRHGLTAETVIEPLEDPEDYKAFEQAVTADYDAETAVERELVLRLASLLWRLRRSTLIETGLLRSKVNSCANSRRAQRKRPPKTARWWQHCGSVDRAPCSSPWMPVAANTQSIGKLWLTPQRSRNHGSPSLGAKSRSVSCACPISTTACSNGLDVMRWHSGAK